MAQRKRKIVDRTIDGLKKLVVAGDSNCSLDHPTQDTTKNWGTLAATALSLTHVDRGIAGSYQLPVGVSGNGEYFTSIALGTDIADAICLVFGGNDVRFLGTPEVVRDSYCRRCDAILSKDIPVFVGLVSPFFSPEPAATAALARRLNDLLRKTFPSRMVLDFETGFLGPRTVTAIATGTEICTAVAHGFATGDGPVNWSSSVLPTTSPSITITTNYWVRREAADTFTLYDTQAHANAGGATGRLDFTGTGTAPHAVGMYTMTSGVIAEGGVHLNVAGHQKRKDVAVALITPRL